MLYNYDFRITLVKIPIKSALRLNFRKMVFTGRKENVSNKINFGQVFDEKFDNINELKLFLASNIAALDSNIQIPTAIKKFEYSLYRR